MILVYTDQPSPRLLFTLEEVISRRLEKSFRLTDSMEEFSAWTGPAINYSAIPSLRGVKITPAGLLSNGIRLLPDEPALSGYPWPVPFGPGKPDFFDVFSSVFFLLSRMEEYEPFTGDRYGRFPAKVSWAFRHNVLHLPLVELWSDALADVLNRNWPGCIEIKRKFQFIPSVDIDNAYAYQYKSWKRQLASSAKDVVRADFGNLKRRIQVLNGAMKDPYDTYDAIFKAHGDRNLRAIYFVLCARPGKFDRNLAPESPPMRKLLNLLDSEGDIGLHPGFASNSDFNLLREEKARLENMIGTEILRSRQHYLYLSFPKTYQNLVKAGFREDYTMGFADEPGFRAGTCLPFAFYDLSGETSSDLLIYPFAFMDATLHVYKGLDKEKSLEVVSSLASEIKARQGICISLWHNETLGGMWNWKGWEDFYPEILDACLI